MQNFGKIKNAFNELVSEGIVTKNSTSQNIFKKYIKAIHENEILRTQFLVITNLETKVESDREKAIEYVKENIKFLTSFDKKKILEANNELFKLSLINDINDDYENKNLHENISKLIFTKRTLNNIDVIVEATNNIVDYIVNNKPKEIIEAIELPSSMLSTIMVDKYNEKYNSLDESDKKVLKALISSTPEEKNVVYNEIISECINLVNINLEENKGNDRLDIFEKLLNVKEKLLNDKLDINEDFEKKISNLIELRSNLK